MADKSIEESAKAKLAKKLGLLDEKPKEQPQGANFNIALTGLPALDQIIEGLNAIAANMASEDANIGAQIAEIAVAQKQLADQVEAGGKLMAELITLLQRNNALLEAPVVPTWDGDKIVKAERKLTKETNNETV